MTIGRLFLLSPASAHGARARPLLELEPRTPLARRLAGVDGVPLGDVFRYLSGLYFNGKLAYARAFALPPSVIHGEGVYVITLSDGLLVPSVTVRTDDMRRFAAVEMGSEMYGRALERGASTLAEQVGAECDVIFLGSVGSGKYTDLLLPIFGERLLFPPVLLSQGQLERGAFLLRCVQEGRELEYVPLAELLSSRVKRGARRSAG